MNLVKKEKLFLVLFGWFAMSFGEVGVQMRLETFSIVIHLNTLMFTVS